MWLKSPGLKCPTISVKYLQMIPTEVGFKSQNLKIGQGFLLLNQTRLPFDISMESLEPFFISFDGYNFSSAGLRLSFRRNRFTLLIGGYYVPTTIFVLLSLVSYSIDMVRHKIHKSSPSTPSNNVTSIIPSNNCCFTVSGFFRSNLK